MAAGDVISFGPYRLIPAERLLLRGGETVNVGSRGLDVLIALAEAAGEVVGQLRRALGVLQSEQHHILTPAFHRALAEGLTQSGEIDEAAAVLDAALARGETLAEPLSIPELLRVRGETWLQTIPADPVAAERAFRLSLQQAKTQSALSLELRSAMGLARLWSSLGKPTDAADLLESIYRRFTEGYQTTDLKLADQLLAALGRRATALDTASGPV
jgi:predicted ATPase